MRYIMFILFIMTFVIWDVSSNRAQFTGARGLVCLPRGGRALTYCQDDAVRAASARLVIESAELGRRPHKDLLGKTAGMRVARLDRSESRGTSPNCRVSSSRKSAMPWRPVQSGPSRPVSSAAHESAKSVASSLRNDVV